MQVGFRYLDVIAENVVKANFERGDVGAFAFALFHGGDDLFAVLAEVAQLVELAFEAVSDVVELVDFVVEAAEEFAAAGGRRHHETLEHGKLRERFAQREKLAGRSQAERDAAGDALEIENAAQFFADFAAHDGLLQEMCDASKARFDGIAIEKRAKNPGAQQARAHAGDSDVKRSEQRGGTGAGGFFGEDGLNQL